MKQAADKSHHTLHKFVRKYEVTEQLIAVSFTFAESFLLMSKEVKCIVEFALILSEISSIPSSCFK